MTKLTLKGGVGDVYDFELITLWGYKTNIKITEGKYFIELYINSRFGIWSCCYCAISDDIADFFYFIKSFTIEDLAKGFSGVIGGKITPNFKSFWEHEWTAFMDNIILEKKKIIIK